MVVEVRVAGVALDPAGQHVILLKPIDASGRASGVLPIWIGAQEATSILVAVEGAPVPRPLAHDLMRSVLEALGAKVERVEVTRLEEGTFYAEVTISSAHGRRALDARPSDAVALAARTGAPIFVADAVMAEAEIPDVLGEVENGEDADEAATIEEFGRFLERVDPDDFRE